MNELKFSATNRALIQRSAFSEPFDLLVIGGGDYRGRDCSRRDY